MGGNHSSKSKVTYDEECEVNFDHFQILRAIGKGSFGKVCIVQKKDTQRMFAMKYMNKNHCRAKDAVRNVVREIEILRTLDHPFLVNLWFSFQDEEDFYMVVDLLLGGDLRYHLHERRFDEPSVRLYVAELALALDYLAKHSIIHRDIKPDNILLDEEGHVHITDFNIATVVREGQLGTSMSGTKPYIAPEVFECAADACQGYSFPVDWWSLGICAYEMLRNKRPFDIHSGTTISEVREMFTCSDLGLDDADVSEPMNDLLRNLLCVDPAKRISSLKSLKERPLMADLDFEAVLQLKMKPSFVPAKDHLNCDPTFELEEMIIESKPLHKKKKRLSKQNSRREQMGSNAEKVLPTPVFNIQEEFTVYNREKELRRQAMEKKEKEWQDELERFMMYDSNPANKSSITSDNKGDKLTVGGRGGGKGHHKKLSPRSSKMISPTVTRRHFPGIGGKGKRSGKDGGESSTSYAKEKEEVQRTLAEAGKLLAMGAVEPLVVLSSVAGCRHKDTT